MANDMRQRAAQLYASGMSMSDIAKELGLSQGTVRSWKARGVFGDATQHDCSVATRRCNAQMTKSVADNDELTEGRKLFCLFYMQSFNGAAAYRRAFPEASDNTARTESWNLLRLPAIRAEIDRLRSIRTESMLARGEDIADRYMRIAFADMTDFADWRAGSVMLKPSGFVDGALVAEVKEGVAGVSIKLADRMQALKWLANYFELQPSDKHRREYDERRLELEMLKAKSQLADEPEDPPDDGFIDAIGDAAQALPTADDSQEDDSDELGDG